MAQRSAPQPLSGGYGGAPYQWQQPASPPGGYATPISPAQVQSAQYSPFQQSPGAPGSVPQLGSAGTTLHGHSRTDSQGSTPASPKLPLPTRGAGEAGRTGLSWGGTSAVQYTAEEEDDLPESFLREIYGKMDQNGNGVVSKLELIAAVTRDHEVAELLGMDGESLLSDESTFDALHALFEEISAGKNGIDFESFLKHVRKASVAKTPRGNKMQEIFNSIDADGNGSISKLELVAAMQSNAAVDDFLTPGVDSSSVMDDEGMFEKVDALFEAIAGGKKRITFNDFSKYYRKAVVAATPRPPSNKNRPATRLFIIGPGFGNQINPRQSQMLETQGYQIKWCFNIPNPEVPNFPVDPYLDQIKAEMDMFKPHVLIAASKGGVYMVGLWRRGYWRGPSLMLNAHPMCTKLPEESNIVVACGSNDEVYPTSRADLEALMATGAPNKTFLYYTANSGQLQSGQLSRVGDYHNMESLLNHDCLPRLVDATLCKEGPEVHFMRTWRERLSNERVQAELWLGYSPDQLIRLWSTKGNKQGDHLVQVLPGSEEYKCVVAAFKAMPKEEQAYILQPPEVWAKVRALRVERVENSLQGDGSWKPYYKSLCRSLEDQGVDFEPGTHSCWAFHGCDARALESIVNNPVSGFQPLASGTRSATLWGSGTYFAREAKYVAEGGFCGAPAADGSRRMLMCLLIPGMPCLGDPNHKGVLPFRQQPHRYNCSVDCMASPEVFIVQQSGAAVPAYVITFA